MGNKGLAPGYQCRCTPRDNLTTPTMPKEVGLNPYLLEAMLEESSGPLRYGLHAACMQAAVTHPRQALLVSILQRGVDPNVKWFERAQKEKPPSGTGLHLATALGKQDLVSVLLKNAADVNIKNSYGETVVHVAASVGHTHILRMILEDGNFRSLNDTSKRRQKENDERLFAQCTALEMAAGYRRAPTVEVLLRFGARIGGAVDACCALANKDDDAELMLLLLRQGLGVNQHRSKRRWTLLHEAADKGNPRIVSALLHAGGKVNACDRSRTTPLVYAICQQQLLVIEQLLRGGADVNLVDCRLYTPLHHAALCGQARVVQMLLIHGARLAATERRHGLMPHHLCIVGGACSNQLALHVMLLHGAALEATTAIGSALKLAWEEEEVGGSEGRPHPYVAQLISHGACDDYILAQLSRVYVNGSDYAWLPATLRLVLYSGNEGGDLRAQLDAVQSWFFAVDHKYYRWLVAERRAAPCLKLQARAAIRRCLRRRAGGTSVWRLIERTRLPCVLQDYLKLSDLYDLEAITQQALLQRGISEDVFTSPFKQTCSVLNTKV